MAHALAFSMASAMAIDNHCRIHLRGYVKPLIKNLRVYESEQERGKSFIQKLREAVVGGAAAAIEDPSSHEVATNIEITGAVSNPEIHTWEAVARLVGHTFFHVIVPGFDRPDATSTVVSLE